MSIIKKIFNSKIDINYFDKFTHPYFESKYIKSVTQDENVINITIELPFVANTIHQSLTTELQNFIYQKNPKASVNIVIRQIIIPHKIKTGINRIANIKNIIAVTSGKGGVGKSTTAVNLALALAHNGASVGILDADIYGPSLPILLNEQNFKPEVVDSKFKVLEKYDMQAMSFGFLIDAKQPAIWRGSIVTKAIEQMLFESTWGELDYLIIDMPPGTGDIHLSMAQKLPLTATIAVTTPQDIALLDVIKSIEMFNKLSISCMGVVENMSTHICSNCGHSEEIFGEGGAKLLQEHYKLDILAKLPLNINIRKASDDGMPIYLTDKKIAAIYDELAIRLSHNISKLPKAFNTVIPQVKTV